MDTLHFEPHRFYSSDAGRWRWEDKARRGDSMNLSEVEVFMLRGRRLQAHVIGGGLRKALGRLRRLLKRSRGGAGSRRQPGYRTHA